MSEMNENARNADAQEKEEETRVPHAGRGTQPCIFAVNSVREATTLIDCFGGYGHSDYDTQLVNYITDEDNCVFGDSDEYHNFVKRLLDVGDYASVIRVCEFALRRFPYSMDILANAIQAAGCAGLFERGREYIRAAEKIDHRFWNWRLFLFTIEYYQNMLNSCEPDSMESLLERAIALAQEYRRYLPFDEHGYNKEAELLITANRREDAIRLLRSAILESHPGESLSSSLLAAQCCVTMLDLLDDSDDYALIIQIAQKGILNTTQEQPSARVGYFMYRMALATDAMAAKEEYRNPETVKLALQRYQCAFDLNKSRNGYIQQIANRYSILCQSTVPPITDRPLIKRELYIDPAEKTGSKA